MRSPVFIPAYEKFNRARKIRLLSVACYFGFTPVLWLVGANKLKNRFLQHHFQLSLLTSLLTFIMACAYIVSTLFGYIFYVYIWTPSFSQFYENQLIIGIGETSTHVLLITGVVFALTIWIIGLTGSWRGKTPYIPFLASFTKNEKVVRFSLFWTAFTQLILVLLIILSVHSMLLPPPSDNPGQLYILYTQGGYIPIEKFYNSYTPPRWTVNLFFYPILQAGANRWGQESIKVLPLSEITFREAIKNGRFIFVASHGGMEPGSFTASYLPYKNFLPSDILPGDTGPQLRYVYFAACYAGTLKTDWENALSPAQVRAFDRLSFVDEHFLWVWFRGAKVISNIE